MNNCKFCELNFIPNSIGRKRKFCSIRCGKKWHSKYRKLITKLCKECGKEFKTKAKRINFCSIKCSAINVGKRHLPKPKRKTGANFSCKICGKGFYAAKNRVDKGKVKYCSRSCLAKELLPKYVKIHGFKKSHLPPRKYKLVTFNGRSIRLHRAVMEEYLGRKLKSSEHVHHIDGNPENNHISNLVILSNSDHGKISYEERQLLAKKLPGPAF